MEREVLVRAPLFLFILPIRIKKLLPKQPLDLGQQGRDAVVEELMQRGARLIGCGFESLRFDAGADCIGAQAVASHHTLYAQLFGSSDAPLGIDHSVEAALIEYGRLDEHAGSALAAHPVGDVEAHGLVHNGIELCEFEAVGEHDARKRGAVDGIVADNFTRDFAGKTRLDGGVAVHESLGSAVAVVDRIAECTENTAHDRFPRADSARYGNDLFQWRSMIYSALSAER